MAYERGKSATPRQRIVHQIATANPKMSKKDVLLKAGYSLTTALKDTKLYDKALDAVAEDTARFFLQSKEEGRKHNKDKSLTVKENEVQPEASDLFAKIGMTRESLILELVKVIKQDKDLNNKLKALSPFLEKTGISLNNQDQTTQPVLNISVTNNKTSEPIKAINIKDNNPT